MAKVFKRGLKAAGLPLHFTPHRLRHSFASLLLSAQVSPAYGRWLPIGNKAAIDGLDDEGVLRIGADGREQAGHGPLAVVARVSGDRPSGSRTVAKW